MRKKPVVAIVMGSESDLTVMNDAAGALVELGISYEMQVLSAHRTPRESAEFASSARKRGIRVIIAGAGLAAHLPGVLAAHTELPVIGVPIATGALNGQDALYSIVQMPKGVPVATVGVGNAWNAGLLAGQIISTGEGRDAKKTKNLLKKYRQTLRKKALSRRFPKKPV